MFLFKGRRNFLIGFLALLAINISTGDDVTTQKEQDELKNYTTAASVETTKEAEINPRLFRTTPSSLAQRRRTSSQSTTVTNSATLSPSSSETTTLTPISTRIPSFRSTTRRKEKKNSRNVSDYSLPGINNLHAFVTTTLSETLLENPTTKRISEYDKENTKDISNNGFEKITTTERYDTNDITTTELVQGHARPTLNIPYSTIDYEKRQLQEIKYTTLSTLQSGDKEKLSSQINLSKNTTDDRHLVDLHENKTYEIKTNEIKNSSTPIEISERLTNGKELNNNSNQSESRATQGKFIKDESMTLPEGNEVWALAGMTTVGDKNSVNYANESENTEEPNTTMETKILTDWTQILQNVDIQNENNYTSTSPKSIENIPSTTNQNNYLSTEGENNKNHRTEQIQHENQILPVTVHSTNSDTSLSGKDLVLSTNSISTTTKIKPSENTVIPFTEDDHKTEMDKEKEHSSVQMKREGGATTSNLEKTTLTFIAKTTETTAVTSGNTSSIKETHSETNTNEDLIASSSTWRSVELGRKATTETLKTEPTTPTSSLLLVLSTLGFTVPSTSTKPKANSLDTTITTAANNRESITPSILNVSSSNSESSMDILSTWKSFPETSTAKLNNIITNLFSSRSQKDIFDATTPKESDFTWSTTTFRTQSEPIPTVNIEPRMSHATTGRMYESTTAGSGEYPSSTGSDDISDYYLSSSTSSNEIPNYGVTTSSETTLPDLSNRILATIIASSTPPTIVTDSSRSTEDKLSSSSTTVHTISTKQEDEYFVETTFKYPLFLPDLDKKSSRSNKSEETTTDTNGHGELGSPADGNNTNVIVAVSVSVVGIIAIIIGVGFLYIMRKRRKTLSYGQRCRPVSLDAYSLDNVSVYNSVRRKAALRASKRSYGNVAFDDPSLKNNLLTIPDLAKFVEKKSSIYDQFKDIPQIIARPDEVPPGCEDKNRYANVIPLPETRVILKQQNDDEKTEYINANFVRGPRDSPNYYIACQAPLESTVADFWRMIWEQNSRVIIMATDLVEDGKEKCAEYLPSSMTLDNHLVYGNYQITLKSRESKEKYVVSLLHVKNCSTNTWREITHFWYQWPDAGVPTDEFGIISMLLEARNFLKAVPTLDEFETEQELTDREKNLKNDAIKNGENIKQKEHEEKSTKINGNLDKTKSLPKTQGPLTVHCSPGTGRTGTIIACDVAMRSLESVKRSVDIPQIVYYVRRGRASAVQTKEQYELIYRIANSYGTKLSGPINEN